MSVIKVNNITNKTGIAGPAIAGIVTVSSSSHFVVPTGHTGQRYADGGENIVRDGLVLYLDAKYSYPGATGTNPDVYTWYDMSGNENHGELIGGVGYSASNGGSLSFDGSDDYVNLNTTLSSIISSSLPTTWSSWVNVVSSSSNRAIIGSAWSNGGVHMRLTGSTHAPQDRIRFLYFTDGNNGTGFDSLSTFTSGWYNFVATYNGGGLSHTNFKFYVNGVEGSVTNPTFGTPTTTPTTQTFSIGRAGTENEAYYNSNIAQVSIYNRALTAAEISQNFNETRSRYGI